MAVSRDKETGTFRFDFQAAGRRYTKRGFRTRHLARTAEFDKRREVKRGLTGLAFPSFRHLVDAWLLAGAATKQPKHLAQVRRNMNKHFASLATLPPMAITRGHIEPVLNRLVKRYTPNTVNCIRRDIAAVFNYGVVMGAVPFNPVRGIPRVPDSGEKKRPIPTAALKTLLLAADADLEARLIFCAQTACRWIEMARLEWEHVVLGERPVALLITRKRRGGHVSRRAQPLTGAVVRAIESQRGRDARYVFPSPRGGQAQYVTDKLHLDQLCRRTKVGRFGWHQLRHWAGTVAARAGRNRRAIADLLGQQSVSAIDRYIHAAAEEVWLMAAELEKELDFGGGPRGAGRGAVTGDNGPR